MKKTGEREDRQVESERMREEKRQERDARGSR